jgi:hypothetical protein
VILARTVTVPDPLTRANVVEALAGAGAPAGVIACTVDGLAVTVTFAPERTPAELIDALIAVETATVAGSARPLRDLAEAAVIAARGLREPALDASRIIETFLP